VTSTHVDRSHLDAALRTESYVFAEGFRGYDPYDALLSPIFRLPLLRSFKVPRLVAQQVLRRLPLNIRPLLGIPRGLNPVTLGLAVEAYAYLASADPDNAGLYRSRALLCIEELKRVRSRGYIVATGIITNALFIAYTLLDIEDAFELCSSATAFVLRDLDRTVAPDGSICWAYFPGDRQQVINATMKGSRLCAQVHSVAPDEELRESARLSAQFAAQHQREDGAWPYAVADPRSWVDNFHTGYVLVCLREYADRTGDDRFEAVTEKGWNYYRDNFFENGEIPRYFDTRTYPIDVTACAQSLLTLSTFGTARMRDSVWSWVVQHMQKADGSFVYQIRKRHTNQISYIRWGAAWMLAALSRVAYETHRSAR
jgi:hypothetical protein